MSVPLQIKYKESIGKGTPIPDLPEVKRVKETQKHISSVVANIFYLPLYSFSELSLQPLVVFMGILLLLLKENRSLTSLLLQQEVEFCSHRYSCITSLHYFCDHRNKIKKIHRGDLTVPKKWSSQRERSELEPLFVVKEPSNSYKWKKVSAFSMLS